MARKIITQTAVLQCDHLTGIVGIIATQNLVTINNIPILVKGDLISRPIAGCPIPASGGSKPCLTTINEKKGHSQLLFIKGKAICLESLTGLTDGVPPGTINYTVNSSGQNLLVEI
ncbi:MAG: hypothetical protein OQL19_01535 [Gammaproteobacteria bacterium]|nr:hypothetical protein [Gammaproteobacteria bacterium]